MPRPEQVLEWPTSRPIVEWDSALTVSKWKIGTATQVATASLPEAPEQLELPLHQFEMYVDVLARSMRETTSPAEREALKQATVSGAFRLSHAQRVFRDVLERVDRHMTALEDEIEADTRSLPDRRADNLRRRQAAEEAFAEQKRTTAAQHELELEEHKQSLSAKLDTDRALLASIEPEIASLRERIQNSLQQAEDVQREDDALLEELRAELESAKTSLVTATTERDAQSEMLAGVQDSQAREMLEVDEAYERVREAWAKWQPRVAEHSRVLTERQAGMDAMRAREDALRGEVSAGEQYLDDLVAGNDELEAEVVRSMRQSEDGAEWYAVVLDVQVTQMSGMTTADTQAKMVADFARTLQVEHSKLVVLKVLPFEDAGIGGKAVFTIMLDDGVYLGNQSPVAAARFLVYLTENFNSAAAERGDDSTSIVCRFLTVEEAAEAVIQAPIETTLSRTTSTVAETACIEILLADFTDMRPMRTDLDRALGTAVQCQDTEAWRIVTLVLPERSDASCTSVRAEIRKLVKQGGSGGGGEQRSAAAVADLLMEQCKDPESRLRTSWPSITSASPWPPRVPPPLPMHSAAGLYECGYAASEGNLESASLSRASLLLRPEYGTGDEVAGEKKMDAADLVLVERQGTESIRSQSRSQTLAKSNPWEPRVLRESKTRLAFSWEEEVLAGSSARYDALEETVALEVPADGSREAEAGAVSGALEVQGISLPPTETTHTENGDEACIRHPSLSSALPAPIPLTPDSVPSKHASKHWTPTPPSGQGTAAATADVVHQEEALAAEDGIEGKLEAGEDGEQAQGTGRRSKSGRAEAQEKLPSDTERSAGGVTASASVEDDPALRVISGGHGIDKERDLTIEGAKDILKAQGGYSDDVVDKTIALLDPQQSGMIKMEDFRKVFQAKMSAPKLRSRGDFSRYAVQRQSFPQVLMTEPDAKNIGASFAGVGIGLASVKRGDKDVVSLTHISPGGPATTVSPPLEVGDEVISIEDVDVDGMSAERAYLFTLGTEKSKCLIQIRRGTKVFRVSCVRANGHEEFSKLRRSKDAVALAASDVLRFYLKPTPSGTATVGIKLGRTAGGLMVVTDVLPHSPAAESGAIQAGDRVSLIEEDDLDGLTADEAEAYLRGPDGSTVRVSLLSAAKTRTVSLLRRSAVADGDAAGINMLVERDSAGNCKVVELVPGGSAAESGKIFVGDCVTAVDGVFTHKLSMQQVTELLVGEEGTEVSITLSSDEVDERSDLRVVPMQRRTPGCDGSFLPMAELTSASMQHRGVVQGSAAPAQGAAAAEGEDGVLAAAADTHADDEACVLRLVLDGDFAQVLEDDEAAQEMFKIRLCDDMAASVHVPKSQLSVVALQAGSILADVRVSVPRPDSDSEDEFLPEKAVDLGGLEKSRSKFKARTAHVIADELLMQANTANSPLRVRRKDVKSAAMLTQSGAGISPAGDEDDAMPAHDRALATDVGELPTEFGSKEIPTLSAALSARPPRKGTRHQSAAKRPTNSDDGEGSVSADSEDEEEESDEDEKDSEDDGIALDLDLPGGRESVGGGYGSQSSTEEDLNAEETIRAQLKEMLSDDFLPDTRVCCSVTHQRFTVASITGDKIPSPPDSDEGGSDEEDDNEEVRERQQQAADRRARFEACRAEIQRAAERPGEFVIVPSWSLVISPQGADLLRESDVVGLYAVEVEEMAVQALKWARLISVTGLKLDQHPLGTSGADSAEEEEEKNMDHDAAIQHAAELGKKLLKLICAAVCADKRVPLEKALVDEAPPDLSHITDDSERELQMLKWKLDQRELNLRALTAEESQTPFVPGPMSLRCARWMRTDKDVLRCRSGSRQGALMVEAMEALLWGEKIAGVRQLRRPLAGIWRRTFSALSRVGWEPGPRSWRRALLQVMPTANEVRNMPPLNPRPDPVDTDDQGGNAVGRIDGKEASFPKHRIFCVVPVVNGAPFDSKRLAGTLLVEAGGTRVKGRIKGVEAFMTMTARTALPMRVLGEPLGLRTCCALHYLEVKVIGNVFGMAIGLVAGSVINLDTWFPDHSLRLEFDGAIRGKGMFEFVPRNSDNDAQAFADGDRIGVLFDVLSCQVAWFVNGSIVAHRCRLPLAHHEARDLRFMIAVRGAQVDMTPAETAARNLAKNVAYEDWLSLAKTDDDAERDPSTLPWLPL